MMQMIRALSTMLFLARQAELAASTDSTGEAHADQTADFDVVGAARSDGDDAPDTFVAADVREFDFCDGCSVAVHCSPGLGVEVCGRLV